MSTPIPNDIQAIHARIATQMDATGMSPDYVQATLAMHMPCNHQPLPPSTPPHPAIVSSCLFQAGLE